MKISIIHPSRSRAAHATDTYRHWIQNSKQDVEYILSIDSSDPDHEQYYAFMPDTKIVESDNHNVVEAANAGAKHATGEIIVLVSDDFQCFNGWDVAVVRALDGKSGLLKTFDGVQKWIVTLPIMTRDYYEAQGYIYHPDYAHMFCDTDQTHKADLEKKLIIRNDIVFTHNHYSIRGGFKKDAVNVKADTTWAQGERVYLQRCREKFGLGSVDIFNLSPEAHRAGHVAWLKKKLR